MKTNYCFGKKRKSKLITIILLIVFLTSCTETKIELASINYPIKNILLLEDNDFEVDNSRYDTEIVTYKIKDMNSYQFFGENFDGEITSNSAEYSGKNFLQFMGDKEEINGFQIHVYTQSESQKLLKTLLKNLGKPSFEDDKGFEKYLVWENSDKIYILNQGFEAVIQNKKTIESDLLCLKTSKLIDVAIGATSNTKYADYLEYRLKNKKNVKIYPFTKYIEEVN
ncbi:hypothetical protein [Chryseobacterium sp.]|uniref:hypothetical protein n=1 Tax=Chryseobacterium sp. TaxID=1871047 RepID=UPI002899BC00|nr:hypothetical protein [Chryseobacterium sp.]